MKSLMRSLVPFILIVCLQAQNSLPKYSVLKTGSGDAYLTSLNQLAAEGYRVLAVGKYTILRLEATPPDTYRYVRLDFNGVRAQFSNWINAQGAHGYRWVPRTGLLEKAPHPRNYEYRSSPHGGLGPSKGGELSWVVEEGYHPLQIVSFSHSLGARTYEMYFERELGQRVSVSPQSATSAIEVADALRVVSVMKHIDELAKQGYRFLSPYQSNKNGGIAVMMERCPDGCVGRYEYSYFDAKNAPQVERDLNVLGKEGFRVLPESLALRPHLLERDTRAGLTFSYRALEPVDGANLEHLLNSADTEGYAPVGFVWHAGWTAQEFVVLERETTASPAP